MVLGAGPATDAAQRIVGRMAVSPIQGTVMAEWTIQDVLEGRSSWAIAVGDCLEVLPKIPRGSVDCIVSDPPYPRRFLPLLAEAWKACYAVSADNAWMFVMSGQIYLPTVMAGLAEAGWCYRWCGAFLMPHMNGAIWPVGISCGWKPLLIYAKRPDQKFAPWKYDTLRPESVYTDDKAEYEWGQDESLFTTLIQRFDVGPLILDPFTGIGATGVACIKTGRRFVGVEIDGERSRISRRRIAEAANTLWTPAAPKHEQVEMFKEQA